MLYKALLNISLPFSLSLGSSPATCSLIQSTPAALVFSMLPQHGWHSPTSGPLHLLLSSHDILLPQTVFLVYIKNLFKCYPLARDSLTVVFNIRRHFLHHYQIFYTCSLCYYMLLFHYHLEDTSSTTSRFSIHLLCIIICYFLIII